MSTEDFLDWKAVSEAMGKNFNINEKGEKVFWNEIKVVTIEKKNLNKIFYKRSYTEENYNIIDVRKKTRTKTGEIALIPAYSEPPAIPNNKKKDLLSLCEQNLIPKKHHQFFMSLKGISLKKNCNNNDDNFE
jgi:hypothetical protein